MRKAIKEYVDLVGVKNGGDRKSECKPCGLTQEEIAKELGVSVRELQNILSDLFSIKRTF
ncbi:helix-turn-helix domain-containing protein [Desulfitobacterium hafniense]|uniref:helix-turn-helix domain-containing protein n=1 Tax=Desulfitobacterium hafniense TaxID=49338 RepID=UPI000038B716